MIDKLKRLYRQRKPEKYDLPTKEEFQALKEYISLDPSKFKDFHFKESMTRDEIKQAIKTWQKNK